MILGTNEKVFGNGNMIRLISRQKMLFFVINNDGNCANG